MVIEATVAIASAIEANSLTLLAFGVDSVIEAQEGAEFSVPGLVVSVLAMPIMYFLSRRKLRLAEALGSGALRADAIESITCAWLSLVVVAGLVTQLLIGAWWVDSVTSLGIVWFLVREGKEAWEAEECCAHH